MTVRCAARSVIISLVTLAGCRVADVTPPPHYSESSAWRSPDLQQAFKNCEIRLDRHADDVKNQQLKSDQLAVAGGIVALAGVALSGVSSVARDRADADSSGEKVGGVLAYVGIGIGFVGGGITLLAQTTDPPTKPLEKYTRSAEHYWKARDLIPDRSVPDNDPSADAAKKLLRDCEK